MVQKFRAPGASIPLFSRGSLKIPCVAYLGRKGGCRRKIDRIVAGANWRSETSGRPEMLAIFAFFNEIYQADRQWRSCRQDTRVKNNDGRMTTHAYRTLL